ncbi:hypothetical protein [Nannocystis punicea]|uniref:Uncharacterized protein n=1 Tax=Nannocystis punicea TaxID=2995304 RepID=A0ABY7H3V2_9BACT|nr:hypothetical protein [Nannocystis poenicansa]WAS93877.1 hypothetical protein O0S08_47705 [Nannocystis poenicansa]
MSSPTESGIGCLEGQAVFLSIQALAGGANGRHRLSRRTANGVCYTGLSRRSPAELSTQPTAE